MEDMQSSEKVATTHVAPFNKPYLTGNEIKYIEACLARGSTAYNGFYTNKCQDWLVDKLDTCHALVTHSCTAALEMAAILLALKPGDEIIMPSFTFVSTASAFVRQGAVPVFVDIREDTLNIDERLIEAAITDKTKAIVAMHYAGISCNMEVILKIAEKHQLEVIEDAAQAILANYNGRPLGSYGCLSTLSFHETKNIISGQGGALLINNPALIERARVLWHKGTNRDQFTEGKIDKYSWTDIGSTFACNEYTAAFLWAQLEQADEIISRRQSVWNTYHNAFEQLEGKGYCKRPTVPENVTHNAHIYYLILPDKNTCVRLMHCLEASGISATRHYTPLHSSVAGKQYGKLGGEMNVTSRISDSLLRLPLWIGVEDHIDFILDKVIENF